MEARSIHPDFMYYLKYKDQTLIDLFIALRTYILELHPTSNELLYHTHALTSLYSVSEKMGDGFCMIPIYTNHLNLGFNKGTLLEDPNNLLQGTGKMMRHIPIRQISDFDNLAVQTLVLNAITLATVDSTAKKLNQGLTVSKIKR